MNRLVSQLAAALSLAALLGSTIVSFAQLAPPNFISFQGRLATPNGTPVPDGTYSLRFSLWDASSAGTEKWNQTISTVAVKNGTFAVPLSGFSTTIFDGNLWLEIQIGTDAPLVPRTPVLSVPYAFKSNLALTVPDGSITNAKLSGGITADKFASNIFNPIAWQLSGNSGVTSGFLGTTDNNPLVFKTNNAERMRILANGNIGIGTGSPTAPLHINDTRTSAAFPSLQVDASSTIGTWLMLSNNTQGGRRWGILSTGSANGEGAGKLLFSDQTALLPRMIIDTVGRVGVGTTNPTAQFQVSGADGIDFSGVTTVGVVQRPTDTVALSLRQPASPPRNTVMQFITGNFGNYIEHERGSGNLLIGTNGSGGNPTLTVATGKVGIGTVAPQYELHNTGAYYGRGNVLLHAFEGEGSNGTAYLSAYDTGSRSAINLILRTKNGSALNNVFWVTSDNRVGVNGSGYGDATLGVIDSGLTYAIGTLGKVAGSQFVTVSDARLKHNIATVPDALSTLLNLRGVTYDWNPNVPNAVKGQKERQYGFLAQEVEQVLPALVHPGLNGYKAVNYQGIIPVTVEAIKAQQSQIALLKAKNAELEAKLDILMKRLDTLEAQNTRTDSGTGTSR